MSVELQLQTRVLSDLIVRGVQARLAATCFPPFPFGAGGAADVAYVDHLDVATASLDVVVTGNAARWQVPVRVFMVTRSSLLAVPNGTPAGATTPMGQAVVDIELTAAVRPSTNAQGHPEIHQYLDLTCSGITPQGPLADAPVNWGELRDRLGSLGSLDLNPMLAAVGNEALAPVPATIELSAGTVLAVRFAAQGPPASHLFPGQEWGLFLDGTEVERLASSRITSRLPASLPLAPTARWAPSGNAPHVDIDVAGEVSVGPVSADVSAHIGCDFVLGPGPSLRTQAHWSIQVDLGWAVPAFVDRAVRKYLEGEIEDALDPASIGAEPLGHHGFAFSTPLPPTAFGGNALGYASLSASSAGMTLGGPVRLQKAGTATLSLKAAPFGLPTRLQLCSVLARTGSGAPQESFTVQDATVYGTITLHDAGQFCGFDPLGLAADLMPFVVGPASGTPGTEHVFSFRLPGMVAITVAQAVRLVVRTARGVRLVDLGVPPKIEVDENGQITNGHDFYLKNCLHLPVGPLDHYGVNWGADETLTTNPDRQWRDFVTLAGVDVQLVTLDRLEPGELIRFRSRDHAVDVTADAAGRAIVPVILPIGLAEQAPASLLRVNRRVISGHLSVQAVVLESQAVLPSGARSLLTPMGNQGALLTTEFADRTDRYVLGTLGAPALLGPRDGGSTAGGDGDSTFPSVSPSERASDTEGGRPSQQAKLSDFGLGLPNVRAVLGIPGFPDPPVAVAIATSGPNLLLDIGDDGHPRVAGIFTGPIGEVALAGRSASAEHAGRVTVYGVTRSAVRAKA
jgi:hypothetical protein